MNPPLLHQGFILTTFSQACRAPHWQLETAQWHKIPPKQATEATSRSRYFKDANSNELLSELLLVELHERVSIDPDGPVDQLWGNVEWFDLQVECPPSIANWLLGETFHLGP